MHASDSLVSVIIPCYNGERYIAETIKSAFDQTHESLELIIIDDGSTDDSVRIIEGFAGNPRVTVLKHDSNKGIPVTRNDGIAAAKGDYLTFLDQDDLWFPTRLEDQLEVFEKDGGRDIGMVFSDVLFLEDGMYRHEPSPYRKVPRRLNEMSTDEVLRRLFVVNFINILTALVTRRCLDDVGWFDEEMLSGADDYELFLRIAARHRVYYLESILAVHRIHQGSYYSLLGSIEEEHRIVRKMLAMEPGLMQLEKKKYGNLSGSLGTYYFLAGDFDKAGRHFREALGYDPLNPEYVFKWLLCNAMRGPFGNLPGHLYGFAKKVWHLI